MDITRLLGTAIAGGILIIIIGSISDYFSKKTSNAKDKEEIRYDNDK